MIDRVEFVKMKDRYQAPIIAPAPKKPDAKVDSKPAVKADPKAIDSKAPPEIQKKVDVMIFKLKNAPGTDKMIPREELEAMGEPAIAYLASRAPDMDISMMDVVMQALVVMKTTAANDVLVQLIGHEKAAVRSFACTILGTQSDENKRTYVRPMMKDRDDRVRATAITLLGSVTEIEWLEPVCDLLGDESRDVRNSAVQISRRLATKHGLQDKFLSALVSNLNATSDDVRADMVAAIGTLGIKDSWSFLTRMLNDREAKVRAGAASALTALAADESGIEVVDALSRERDATVRLGLAQVVMRLRLMKAVEPLIEWLGDSDESVRKAAENALRLLTGESLGQDREAWANWLKNNKK
jgi:HEAT repeat protein